MFAIPSTEWGRGTTTDKQDYLPNILTADQLKAVLHHGSPLLIIAGPGSGKTEVLAWRVVHLIRAGLVEPTELLVTTFTNKAADQLKDRIQLRLPETNVEAMQISTIHSFCARLLRDHIESNPLRSGFRILDSESQFLYVFARRKELGLDELVKGRVHAFYSDVLRLFNLATEELVDSDKLLDRYLAHKKEDEGDEDGLWDERIQVAKAYNRYREMILEDGLADFGHLQRLAYEMLDQNADVLAEVQDHYRELLIDEYQDTNAAQDRLLKLIAAERGWITVVGDDDQAIYRFRGATVKNLQRFEHEIPDAKKIVLPDDFRNLNPILAGAVDVIRHNDPHRIEKNLRPVRPGPSSDVLLVYQRSVPEEAAATVDLLGRLHATGEIGRWGDVALLLRSVKSYAEPYLAEMARAVIPFQVTGDASFFDRDEIRQLYDLFSFLSASKNWGDRFLRSELVGLKLETEKSLKAFKGFLMEVGFDSEAEKVGIDDPDDLKRLADLHALKRRVQAKEHRSLLEVLYSLLAITGCVQRFERAGDVQALANLGVMTRLVADWDEFGNSRNFYAFQRFLKLLREGGVDPAAAPAGDAVQVMTLHQAKGLEFPVVVLGSVMNGRLPTSERADHYAVPYDLRASGAPEVDDPHLVDERKLFYVGATRARDLLVVGTADVVNKRGGGPSPFLIEMFGQDLQAAADLSERKIQNVTGLKAAPETHNGRYSFSDLAYYLQCPMRYKFATVYGFEGPWLDPVDFGSNVHRALDEIHKRVLAGGVPSEEDVETILNEVWTSGSYVEEETQKGYIDAAAKQIRRYLSQSADDLPRILESEAAFSAQVAGRILSGKYDLLRRSAEGAGVDVVDFKTSNSVDLERTGIDLQLGLYAKGVEERDGHQVSECTAHFLGDGQVRRLPWSDEVESRATERIGEVLDQIEAKDFTPRTDYCRQCEEYRAICPHSVTEKTS